LYKDFKQHLIQTMTLHKSCIRVAVHVEDQFTWWLMLSRCSEPSLLDTKSMELLTILPSKESHLESNLCSLPATNKMRVAVCAGGSN